MIITINTKEITIDQCTIDIWAEVSDIPVRGNAIVSGDNAYDKKCEDEILDYINNGHYWMWSDIRVTVSYKGYSGAAYLGACSYKSEEDFKSGGYFEDMKIEAFDNLIKVIEWTFDSENEKQIEQQIEANEVKQDMGLL